MNELLSWLAIALGSWLLLGVLVNFMRGLPQPVSERCIENALEAYLDRKVNDDGYFHETYANRFMRYKDRQQITKAVIQFKGDQLTVIIDRVTMYGLMDRHGFHVDPNWIVMEKPYVQSED